MKFYMDYCLILLFLSCLCAAKKKQKLEIISVSKPVDCSKTAENGDSVAVHYTGKLENGQIFDSSIVAKREPIKFELGLGKVIKGWETGIQGMCVGEKRKLIIPPDLAYGSNGVQGAIPPDATLVFETELVGLDKLSAFNANNIWKFINFAIWPAIILGVLVMLYKRMTAAEEKIKSEKYEKKHRKRKH
ncbi:FK506-binding protein 2-like [Dendronephthya gigantea]|uniref:FK506-binding protein 2-like n=1 Tax=Dendronephthya gigantea TaxID=151771 RepID=UPI0010697B85|nr:FK506-binding protein 2-like [Dendronephthya gigantea]